MLSVEGADGPEDERRYALPPGPAEVLTDPSSLNYLAPVARMFAAPVGPAAGPARRLPPAVAASAGTSSATTPASRRPT